MASSAHDGGNQAQKVKWLDDECNICGRKINSWDVKMAKAVGYTKSFPCEVCLGKEYEMTKDELRDFFEEHFGMRPCQGI